MKKNYIMSSLIGIMIFFSCASCVFGGDEMDKNYLVTINGIEMYYKDAATMLLDQIIKEEKEAVSVVDKGIGKNLDITMDILKPERNILINNSKNMAKILELFETVKSYAANPQNKVSSGVIFEANFILLMRVGNEFTISKNYIDDKTKTFLSVNDKNQITKINIISNAPSEIKGATPIFE